MPKKSTPAVPGYDGPRKTALESIRLHCVQCMSGSFALVTDCPSKDCIFFNYRAGTIEPGASRRLLRVIRSYCDTCAPEGDVAGCTAGRCYLDLSPCPIWPFRLGRSPYYGEGRKERLREHAIRSGSEANFRPRLDGTYPAHTSGQPAGNGRTL